MSFIAGKLLGGTAFFKTKGIKCGNAQGYMEHGAFRGINSMAGGKSSGL